MQNIVSKISQITALTSTLQEAKRVGVYQLRQHAVPASAEESVRTLFERIGQIAAGESIRWDQSRVWGIEYTVQSSSAVVVSVQIGNDGTGHLEDNVMAHSQSICSVSAGVRIIRDAGDLSRIVRESTMSVSRCHTFASVAWRGLPVHDVQEVTPQAAVLFVGSVQPEIRIIHDAYDETRIVQESAQSVSCGVIFVSAAWYGFPKPDLSENMPFATVSFASAVRPEVRITRDAYDVSRIVQKSKTSASHIDLFASAAWYGLPGPETPGERPKATVSQTGSVTAGVSRLVDQYDGSKIVTLEHQIESHGETVAKIIFTEAPLITP